MSIAKATVVGNLGGDPETRYTPSGAMNVRFSVASSRRYRDSSGQDQEKTTWFRVTAWGRLAETIDGLVQRGFVSKGRQVYVEGRIELSEWTGNDGEKRASLEVNATEFQLVGNRPDGQGQGEGGGYSSGANSGGNTGGGGRRESVDDSSSSRESNFDDVPF
ncbi:MAG: single-stranded DNA-binding protein [Chloroflexia bacterium]|nr:single-stranded DNA-binding protein [Chloroflexia bacterium]